MGLGLQVTARQQCEVTIAAKHDPIQAKRMQIGLQGFCPEHIEVVTRLNPKMQQCMPFPQVSRSAYAGRWQSWRGLLR